MRCHGLAFPFLTMSEKDSPPRQRQRLDKAGKPNPKPKVQQKLPFGEFLGLFVRSSSQRSEFPPPRLCSLLRSHLTLGHEQGQQQQQQQAPAGSEASSDQPKKVKKVKRVVDDELASSWLMSHPWVVYTGKRSPAGHRYATCSCCTVDNPSLAARGRGQW